MQVFLACKDCGMDQYESLREDLAELGAAMNRYAGAVNRHTQVTDEQIGRIWGDVAKLRDELNAVANRVEALTRAWLADPAGVAQAIVNDANRSTLREVHDAGSPLYREERGRYLIECSCGWEYEGKTEQDAKIAYGQHADRFVA